MRASVQHEHSATAGCGGVSHSPSHALIQQMNLSQEIIPAVQGEYYSYTSVFTADRPLYALLKCKANKARPVSDLSDLGTEVGAFLQLGVETQKILSVQEACRLGLLSDVRSQSFFPTIRFAQAGLTLAQFETLQAGKDGQALARVCKQACEKSQVVMKIREGKIIAFVTNLGKYGVFLVERVSSFSVQIAACHILL